MYKLKLFFFFAISSFFIISCSDESPAGLETIVESEHSKSLKSIVDRVSKKDGMLVFENFDHFIDLQKVLSNIKEEEKEEVLNLLPDIYSFQEAIDDIYDVDEQILKSPLFEKIEVNGETLWLPVIIENSVLSLILNENLKAKIGDNVIEHDYDKLLLRSSSDNSIIETFEIENTVETIDSKNSNLRAPDCNSFFTPDKRRKLNGRFRSSRTRFANLTFISYIFRAAGEKKTGIFGRWKGEQIYFARAARNDISFTNGISYGFSYAQCYNCKRAELTLNHWFAGSVYIDSYSGYVRGIRNGVTRSCTLNQ